MVKKTTVLLKKHATSSVQSSDDNSNHSTIDPADEADQTYVPSSPSDSWFPGEKITKQSPKKNPIRNHFGKLEETM